MKEETVGFHGCTEYDFYLLHAKLYLLTALKRIAIDSCELLIIHADAFAALALDGPAHILIQRTAAEICLNIAESKPSAFTRESLEKLKVVGFSPFPLERYDQRSEFKKAPWDSPRTPIHDGRHYFENDFGWYWFPELRTLFGVGQHHVEYLAKNFIETSLARTQKSGTPWLKDKRSNTRSSHHSRSENFYHSHSSYPTADTFAFYCEYHSFLHAAGRLLETTPVTQEDEYWNQEEDPLESWITGHSLTLGDGTWLSDRRDPAPLRRRSWTKKAISENWKTEIPEEDFENILLCSMPKKNWLILHGRWTDCMDSAVETLRVKSALVDPRTADALGRYLSCQESPYDFAFPLHSDGDSGINDDLFVLQGIVRRNSENSYSLPCQDPYAGNLPYPPLELAKEYTDLLGIQPDLEDRIWRKLKSDSPVMISEIWNEQGDETHKTYPSGRRIGSDKSLMTELCRKTAMDLILCVEIHRSYEHNSSHEMRENEDARKRGNHFKIFI